MSKESKMSPGSETVSLRRIREINRMAKRCDLTPGELQALSYFAYCWLEEHQGPEDEEDEEDE